MKFCAALIPTRNTVENLRRCLAGYFGSASRPQDIEAVLRVDDDNKETIAALPKLESEFGNVRWIVGNRMQGYASVPFFNLECVKWCNSRWTMTICDDSELSGKGWDDQIKEMEHKRAVMDFAVRPEFYIEDHGTHQDRYEKKSDTESEHSIGIVVPRSLWTQPGNAPTPTYCNKPGLPLDETWRDNATDIWALAVVRSKGWPIRTLKGLTYIHHRVENAPHRQSL